MNPNPVNGVVTDSSGTVTHRECRGYGETPAHVLAFTPENFSPWAMDLDRKKVMCRNCDRDYRRDHKGKGAQTRKASQSLADARAAFARAGSATVAEEPAEEKTIGKHEYVPNPELIVLWKTIVDNTLQRGLPPRNVIFFGPSGSGKTEGARHLADAVGLAFTKVDAASMTDPEAWFGTREVVVEAGVPVTKYIPSAFVESLQKPGVTFIDEMNRVDDEHRNVVLPLTDGTGRVTNPLTGEVLQRHPHNFIIMAGNRGLQFTGTSAVDPAFTTRALTVEFDYIDEAAEVKVAMDATGVDQATAYVFARFAAEARAKAKADPDFAPISTREVIAACELVSGGMDRDVAAKFAVINAASPEGGSASVRQELENIWAGVRVVSPPVPETDDDEDEDTDTVGLAGWVCPVHKQARTVQGGVSQRTGRPYGPFQACPVPFCDETENKSGANHGPVKVARKSAAGQGGVVCQGCGYQNQPGRTVVCANCGASLK